MSTPLAAPAGHPRRVLVVLMVLFLAPVAIAFVLYYGIGWSPGKRVNHGELIEPPVPLPELALPRAESAEVAPPALAPAAVLKGKWTLLYFGAGDCSAACRTALYDTRQVRTALGADRERVQRVFLAEGRCCDVAWLHAQQPDLLTLEASAAAAPLTAILLHAGRGPAADRVYVVDPLGNLMMTYSPRAEPKGMLEDLKKLLRLSHVG
jgi:cytochrome oxidase Cu insertion factor (SCO1/SenC/PrrC family)